MAWSRKRVGKQTRLRRRIVTSLSGIRLGRTKKSFSITQKRIYVHAQDAQALRDPGLAILTCSSRCRCSAVQFGTRPVDNVLSMLGRVCAWCLSLSGTASEVHSQRGATTRDLRPTNRPTCARCAAGCGAISAPWAMLLMNGHQLARDWDELFFPLPIQLCSVSLPPPDSSNIHAHPLAFQLQASKLGYRASY